MKKDLGIIFIFFFLFLQNCTTRPVQKTSKPLVEPIPPNELIRSNFQQVSDVVLFQIDSVKIKERIYADDGRLGYVVFEFFGNIKKVYKGDLKSNQQLKYKSWAEYDPNWKKNWQAGEDLFVFLNRDKKTNEFYVIEVGQFKRTNGLASLMERRKKEGKREVKQ